METLFTVKEVAKYMGIAVRTVERLLAGGHLPSVKWGKAHRIKKSDVEELMLKGWTMSRK